MTALALIPEDFAEVRETAVARTPEGAPLSHRRSLFPAYRPHARRYRLSWGLMTVAERTELLARWDETRGGAGIFQMIDPVEGGNPDWRFVGDSLQIRQINGQFAQAEVLIERLRG